MLRLALDGQPVEPLNLFWINVCAEGAGLPVEIEGSIVGRVGVSRIPSQCDLEDLGCLGQVVLIDG